MMQHAHSTEQIIPIDDPEGVRVGVLSFHNSKETKALLNAVTALGHEAICLAEENARIWISDGAIHFNPDIDIVVNRLLATKSDQPLDDLGVATSYAAVRPVLNPPEAVIRAMHKYGAAATLVANDIPVPDAYIAFTRRTLHNGHSPITGQTVHKPVIGTNGAGMVLIDAEENVAPWIAQKRAFLQQYLKSDTDRPFDIRAYIVDGQFIGAMKRYAPPEEWRTNVALGGEVENVTNDLSVTAKKLAVRATNVLGLDYAGVDILNQDGSWYVLEVNATAGFKGLFEATGINIAPYIARLAIERTGATVDDECFTPLTATLDDSSQCGRRVSTRN